MSLSMDRSAVVRLTKEINDLRSKEAAEMRKEADANKKANAALASASRASSQSSSSMYLSTATRESKNAENAQDRRARYSLDIARKSQDLVRAQERLSQGEEAERRSVAAADDKRRKDDESARRALAAANENLRREYEGRIANLEAQISAQIENQAQQSAPFRITAAEGQIEPYDFFISHASSDKEDFVDDFVKKCSLNGLRVWYDGFAINWGDSIRQKIDEGLRSAYFGVVILSPNFFERSWTNYELDAIVQKDLSGSGRLLPVWHRLTQDDVEQKAPALAGRLALSTSSSSTDAIVKELINVRDKFRKAAS